ncbi:MAG TPA: penicillin acylase family protein [Candidatus Eisenbacteria bacterium]
MPPRSSAITQSRSIVPLPRAAALDTALPRWQIAAVRAPPILTAFALASLLLPVRPAGAPEGARGAIALPGLGAPVTMLTDRYGIPHLQARSLADLYLAWGYVTARDRLWQLEHSRRAGRGQLWRWFGNATLRADGGAQLFRLGERADAIWAREHADPRSALPLQRYTAGINAFIARCRSGAERWPAEFAALGRTPADWKPEDSVLILLGLGVTLDLDIPEVEEGREVERHGLAWTRDRRRFEGDWIYDTIPDSAARRLYGRGALGATGARMAPPSDAGALAARPDATPGDPALLEGAAAALAPYLHDPGDQGERRASNVFAVGPGRSASGAPLFANDPHLTLASPGPFHVLHLSVADTVDAIGAAVPGLPAIVSGRNRRCAWGVTALSADVIDLYADTLSADGRRVRFAGRWAKVEEAPYDLRFRWLGVPLPALGQVRRYTPHGPVVAFDRKRRVALSVRWSAMEDGRITLGGLVGLERSRSAAEIARRFRTLVTPGINAVAADRDGDVVYQTAGLVPRRAAEPPPGPLPGDGAHEWLGFIPADSMPAWHAPRGGFVVNCNNRPVGPAYPEAWPRQDWVQDRAARIAQRLAGDHRLTLESACSVQNDVFARAGERLVPRLVRCADSLPGRLTPRMRAALDTLRGWDYLARRGRVAPALFRAWYGALARRSRVEGLQGLAVAALDGRAPEALRVPGAESPERPAAAAVAALDTALALLEGRMGPNLARWTWGRVHRAHFRHLPLAIASPAAFASPAPVAEDGDGSSPAVAPSRLPWSLTVTHGPAWRHVVDLAADSSLGIVSPGNSGDARSPHARDHLPLWVDHRYVPLYLDWDRAETVKESEVELVPERGGGGPTGRP